MTLEEPNHWERKKLPQLLNDQSFFKKNYINSQAPLLSVLLLSSFTHLSVVPLICQIIVKINSIDRSSILNTLSCQCLSKYKTKALHYSVKRPFLVGARAV